MRKIFKFFCCYVSTLEGHVFSHTCSSSITHPAPSFPFYSAKTAAFREVEKCFPPSKGKVLASFRLFRAYTSYTQLNNLAEEGAKEEILMGKTVSDSHPTSLNF